MDLLVDIYNKSVSKLILMLLCGLEDPVKIEPPQIL